MKPDFGSRVRSAFINHGNLCVGIDPSDSELRQFGLSVDVRSLEHFSQTVLDATVGRVGFIKPQVAFFERFGSLGFAVLERLCSEAQSAGLIVIADAKRGDIGSTLGGYVKAWLEDDSPFKVDAITLSPYLGPDSLWSAAECASRNSKGIFILSATSNSEARGLQSAKGESGSVASMVANFALSCNDQTFGPAGLVIGATISTADYGLNIDKLSGLPILAPGFGHQGAKLSSIRSIFAGAAENVICNVGRSITSAGPKELVGRINEAKAELELGMRVQ